MKKLLFMICILFISGALLAQDEEETTQSKPGPLLVGAYGSMGFTISGEKNLNKNANWSSSNYEGGEVFPSFGLGYSAGVTLGYRVVDNPAESLDGIMPTLGLEFSAKNHKYTNYSLFWGGEKQTAQYKTFFMALTSGLRFIFDPIYFEPGLYLGFPIKDWKYKRVDEYSLNGINNRDVVLNEKVRRNDFGIYLQMGSLIEITDSIYADLGIHMRFGITRTIDNKDISIDTESANRFFMAFRFGVMTCIDI